MIRLTREIRFALPIDGENGSSNDELFNAPVSNSWAGWPATETLSPNLVLQCSLTGEIDPKTDYLCNVKVVDKILRDVVVSGGFRDLARRQPLTGYSVMIRLAWNLCIQHRPTETTLDQVRLLASPYLHYLIQSDNENMICITQQFEFSASHRLHNWKLTDEQNRQLYGKCNNPNGHGHNYVVEVTIGQNDVAGNSQGLPLSELQRIVKQTVVDPLDHKHLNQEVEPFDTLNPTVENIAVTIWNWLEGKLEPAVLKNVRVYETPKTWADFCGI